MKNKTEPIMAECVELLRQICFETNNGKLLNCRMTKRQHELLPVLRRRGWIRRASFMEFGDAHCVTDKGRTVFPVGGGK